MFFSSDRLHMKKGPDVRVPREMTEATRPSGSRMAGSGDYPAALRGGWFCMVSQQQDAVKTLMSFSSQGLADSLIPSMLLGL